MIHAYTLHEKTLGKQKSIEMSADGQDDALE